MSSHEDFFYEVYHEIRSAGVADEFYKQLDKMKFQDHHKYKSVKESWEYARKKLIRTKSHQLDLKDKI